MCAHNLISPPRIGASPASRESNINIMFQNSLAALTNLCKCFTWDSRLETFPLTEGMGRNPPPLRGVEEIPDLLTRFAGIPMVYKVGIERFKIVALRTKCSRIDKGLSDYECVMKKRNLRQSAGIGLDANLRHSKSLNKINMKVHRICI